MATIADYLPGGSKDPNAVDGIDSEIADASQQQVARQTDATQPVDWESRYKELEKLNSRQAQNLGTYKKMVDEFIVQSPTPSAAPEVVEPPQKITVDDIYADPDEAIRKVVDSHPDVLEAKQVKIDREKEKLEAEMERFQTRHPDYENLLVSDEFRNWVGEDATRVDLYQRGNSFDLSAADALFSLFKAENGLSRISTEQEQAAAIQAVELESSSNAMPPAAHVYSRAEYVDQFMRMKQGDLAAESWVKRNAAKYREALASGNVRD